MLLLAWLVLLWVSAYTPVLQTCSDAVARVGSMPLVRSCQSLSITDAPMLAILVVAALLLFPDLSAFEIPGVVRLERKIAEQAAQQSEKQDAIMEMIRNVEMSQLQKVTVINAAASEAARVAELVGQTDLKVQQFNNPKAPVAEQANSQEPGVPNIDPDS